MNCNDDYFQKLKKLYLMKKIQLLYLAEDFLYICMVIILIIKKEELKEKNGTINMFQLVDMTIFKLSFKNEY